MRSREHRSNSQYIQEIDGTNRRNLIPGVPETVELIVGVPLLVMAAAIGNALEMKRYENLRRAKEERFTQENSSNKPTKI